MDPFNFLLWSLLSGGGFAVGRFLGARSAGKGLAQQQRLEQLIDDRAGKVREEMRVRLAAALDHRQRQDERLEQLTSQFFDVRDRVEQLEEASAGKVSQLEAAGQQLEQLESFAATTATEISALRQKLNEQPPAPAAQWMWPGVQTAPQQAAAPAPAAAPAAAPVMAALQEVQTLQQAAQAEWARRQRAAAEMAFQQPAGGGQ